MCVTIKNKQSKNKLYKTLDYVSTDTLNLNFSENFSTTFCVSFFEENVPHVTFY